MAPKINKSKTTTKPPSKSKATPKAIAKAAPKATPKAIAKAAPKATPKAIAKAAPKAIAKAAPKATPKAAPKAAAKATSKAAAKAAAKSTEDAKAQSKDSSKKNSTDTKRVTRSGGIQSGIAESKASIDQAIDLTLNDEKDEADSDVLDIKKYMNMLHTNRYNDPDISKNVLMQLKKMRYAALQDEAHALELMTLDTYEFAFKKFIKRCYKGISDMSEIITDSNNIIKIFEKIVLVDSGSNTDPVNVTGNGQDDSYLMTRRNFNILVAAWHHFMRFFPNDDLKMNALVTYNAAFDELKKSNV